LTSSSSNFSFKEEQAVFAARNHLKEARLQLEVYRDPESEDEHLVLYARFPAYDETVMRKIGAARRQYRHLLRGKSGWFILTTDFQKPMDQAGAVHSVDSKPII
jgi:hypothetical protein